MSVLDQMTAGIIDRKAARAATLTPVGMEKGAAPVKHGPLDGSQDAPFPFDDPQTVKGAIRDALKEVQTLRYHIDHVADGLTALAVAYGMKLDDDGPDAEAEYAARKAAEAQADARIVSGEAETYVVTQPTPPPPEPEHADFAAEFKAKAMAAQDATFGVVEPIAPVPVPVGSGGWACTTHGDVSVVDLTSRKGRKYRGCSVDGCGQFEK